jgi:hypothetical protein
VGAGLSSFLLHEVSTIVAPQVRMAASIHIFDFLIDKKVLGIDFCAKVVNSRRNRNMQRFVAIKF